MPRDWSLLSSHGRALVILAGRPTSRLRDLAKDLGLTPRAVQDIVRDLEESGYLERHREGRRNRYVVRGDRPMHDPVSADHDAADLLHALGVEPRVPPTSGPLRAVDPGLQRPPLPGAAARPAGGRGPAGDVRGAPVAGRQLRARRTGRNRDPRRRRARRRRRPAAHGPGRPPGLPGARRRRASLGRHLPHPPRRHRTPPPRRRSCPPTVRRGARAVVPRPRRRPAGRRPCPADDPDPGDRAGRRCRRSGQQHGQQHGQQQANSTANSPANSPEGAIG